MLDSAVNCRRNAVTRVGPAVFYFLLALTSWAHAECEWVLWVESPVGSDQWSIAPVPRPRFEAKVDCDRRAETLTAGLLAALPEIRAKLGKDVLAAYDSDPAATLSR